MGVKNNLAKTGSEGGAYILRLRRQNCLQANQATLTEHPSRLSAVEIMASDHDNRLAALELQVTHLRDANKTSLDKVVDLEARSRRQNTKIVGLPEKAESNRPAKFVSKLI